MKKLLLGFAALISLSAFAGEVVKVTVNGSHLTAEYAYEQRLDSAFIVLPTLKKKVTKCEERNGEVIAVAVISVKDLNTRRGDSFGTEYKKFRFNLKRLCGGVNKIEINEKLYSL